MLTGHIPKDYAPYVDSWIGINLIRRPEYSGAPVFPIPAPNGGCPSDAFYDHPDLWDISTEYGRSRWEAIDYLLSLLEVMDVTDAQSDENALFCET